MTWTRLDDGFWSNPKVLAAGNEAAGAYARALSYCGCHETDGKIPTDVAKFIAKPKVLQTLIDAGLVELNGAGYVIPDYLTFNPSHESLEAKREADRRRKAAGK